MFILIATVVVCVGVLMVVMAVLTHDRRMERVAEEFRSRNPHRCKNCPDIAGRKQPISPDESVWKGISHGGH